MPALLGLKGNLDMTMAARLSTLANLGHMSSWKEIIYIVKGNIALVQVQATVAGFLVSVFALSIGAAMDGSFEYNHAFLVIASSIFTATFSCFVLGESFFIVKSGFVITCAVNTKFSTGGVINGRPHESLTSNLIRAETSADAQKISMETY